MRLFITLFILFFSNLFLNLAQATPNAPDSAPRKTSMTRVIEGDHKKSKPTKSDKKAPTPIKSKKPDAANTGNATPQTTTSTAKHLSEKSSSKTQNATPAPVKKERKKSNTDSKVKLASTHSKRKSGLKDKAETGKKEKLDKGLALSATHKKRYQHAKLTAMNKLMSQVGKPYHWGGTSPFTGFDCSGLVYYAYKDVVKIQIPRTANEMYHLRDAAPIKKNELESGDLVFFRINNRGAADHVGVYLGNGKFIQSPRTGSDIRISKLSEDYWQDHYVGARRVVTPQTIR
ncbi:endopeptidase [Brenneria roseae subsp. americana]|uniref:Endopeptidase n=1 Tax=Brenneria roseae subsp. americana TaxID=1508507 RepID=A0A2U1TXH2_9GAMM|nr:C40 family peptidase [Brenneria roseae]PWC14089.1 endopeptidase [Brenneria roseae subsp. americana]